MVHGYRGLPKIQKDTLPLRGVGSTLGSPYEEISRYLIPILRTIKERCCLFVKNSSKLKEKVKDWGIESYDCYIIKVSYDVEKLYPSIPIKKTLQMVEKLFRKCGTLGRVTELRVVSIVELLRWMFKLTYCEYNWKLYMLNNGPGKIANIYMKDFQIRTIIPRRIHWINGMGTWMTVNSNTRRKIKKRELNIQTNWKKE